MKQRVYVDFNCRTEDGAAVIIDVLGVLGDPVKAEQVTQEFADEMGADGYGKDAMACVALAKRLMGVEAR